MFITCAIARVSSDLTRMELVNAGHCPVLLLNKAGLTREFEPVGPPLGLFPTTSYGHDEVELTSDDAVMIVTDGLYEWQDDGKWWGMGEPEGFGGPSRTHGSGGILESHAAPNPRERGRGQTCRRPNHVVLETHSRCRPNRNREQTMKRVLVADDEPVTLRLHPAGVASDRSGSSLVRGRRQRHR